MVAGSAGTRPPPCGGSPCGGLPLSRTGRRHGVERLAHFIPRAWDEAPGATTVCLEREAWELVLPAVRDARTAKPEGGHRRPVAG